MVFPTSAIALSTSSTSAISPPSVRQRAFAATTYRSDRSMAHVVSILLTYDLQQPTSKQVFVSDGTVAVAVGHFELALPLPIRQIYGSPKSKSGSVARINLCP